MNSGPSFTVEDDIQRMKDEVFQLRLERVVLVEGKSDVHFWGRVFEQVISQQFKVYAFVHFPTDYSAGKTTLIRYYLPHAGHELILCLDSDYDYLSGIQGLSHPFVFQTYVHSVENFLCYAPSLSGILALGTRTVHAAFDFESFLSRYSEAVYHWLICQLYLKQTVQTEPEHPPVFVFITDPEANLLELARQTETRSAPHFMAFENIPEFQNLMPQMTDLGFTPQNAYLFVRGHDLLEKVVLKLIKHIAEPIIEHEFSLLSSAERGSYAEYQKQNSFEKLLMQNTRFEDCPFYQKIIEDVRHAFA